MGCFSQLSSRERERTYLEYPTKPNPATRPTAKTEQITATTGEPEVELELLLVFEATGEESDSCTLEGEVEEVDRAAPEDGSVRPESDPPTDCCGCCCWD